MRVNNYTQILQSVCNTLYLHKVFCVKEKEALTVVYQLLAAFSSLVSNKIFHSRTATAFQGIVTFCVERDY